MAGYLYYCKNCNNFTIDKFDDDIIYCDKCRKKMISIHVNMDAWRYMSPEQKRDIVSKYIRNSEEQNEEKYREKNAKGKKYRAALIGLICIFFFLLAGIAMVLGLIRLPDFLYPKNIANYVIETIAGLMGQELTGQDDTSLDIITILDDNKEGGSDSDQAGSYEDIYNEYADKLRKAASELIEENKNDTGAGNTQNENSEGTQSSEVNESNEGAQNNAGSTDNAEDLNDKIEKLAIIKTEGVEKMAEFKEKEGTGSEREYDRWSQKLYEVYDEEVNKIYVEFLQE